MIIQEKLDFGEKIGSVFIVNKHQNYAKFIFNMFSKVITFKLNGKNFSQKNSPESSFSCIC